MLTEKEVVAYMKNFAYFSEGADIACEEIGDGNLNYVYRLVDKNSKKSLILKQSGPVARISDEFKVSPDRNRIESEILKLQGELAPGLVPAVYHYNPLLNATVMEDLSDHETLRHGLLQGKTYPQFAGDITTFLVNTLLLTSDVASGHKEKKEQVKSFTNPELCEITEDLVFTEPFYASPRNELSSQLESFVQKELWNDPNLLLETAKLKFGFMSHAQSLVHGDLHTGSIFVKADSTKVFDPEFAFYGPAGYDIGNLMANLIFAYAHHLAVSQNEVFQTYLTDTISQVVELFKTKFLEKWEEVATEPTARYKGFKEFYLDEIITDSMGIAGHELARRIIGIAKVKDITSIKEEKARLSAEIFCLSLAKDLIMNRSQIKNGDQLIKTIRFHEKNFDGTLQTSEQEIA